MTRRLAAVLAILAAALPGPASAQAQKPAAKQAAAQAAPSAPSANHLALARALVVVPGVVEHGLFLGLATAAILAEDRAGQAHVTVLGRID